MLEALESRRLLAVAFNELPIPTPASQSSWITPNPNGNLYFAETAGNQIGQLNPTSRALTEFPIPTSGSAPSSITTGSDGNLYFTAYGTGQIGAFNPSTHVFTSFPISNVSGGAGVITSGKEGDLYFTETDANAIGQLNPSTHAVATYPIPTPNSAPTGIATGSNGDLYFVESGANQIGQFNPTSHAIIEYAIPTAASGASNIAPGSDGNLYIAETSANQLGQFNPTTRGFVAFPIPTANSGVTNLTAGPDGNLYFTESSAGQIGQFNPSTRGFVELPTPTAGSGPTGIAAGPDGNLYFTETAANQIGELVVGRVAATTTQLTVAPNPAVVGQAVTLTATVSASGGAAPTGTVTFIIDGTAQRPVRLNARGGKGVATMTLKLADATHLITARYQGNASSGVSTSNPVTLVVYPTPGDGPTVVHFVRLGYHESPTTLVLTFDKALAPAPAQEPGNYKITTSSGHRIRTRSIVYDPSTLTVTISPRQRLDLHRPYRLTVIGAAPTGVTDTDGVLLDGALTGHPGSNYVTSVNELDLHIPAKKGK